MAAALLVTGACVSVQGKVYPVWSIGSASVAYEAKSDLAGKTLLSIRVVHEMADLVPPDVKVSMQRPGDPLSAHFDLYGNTNPADFDAVPLGTWNLEISIPTSRKIVRCSVTMKANQVCRIRVVFLDNNEVTVASAGA